jgi:hypothetical protein
MRVLLDECLPRKLGRELLDHEVSTVQREGWAGLRNGNLLRVASCRFDVFLTVDRNIPFQQNVKTFDIAVVVIKTRGIRLRDLRPLMAEVRDALARSRPGQLTLVGGQPPGFTLKESSYAAMMQPGT